VEVSPAQVVVYPGGKPVMFFMLLALLEDGDEAVYPNPGFPIYESMIRFSGATAVPLPLRPEHGFRADVDELRGLVTPRTKLIVINSPQNPTGSMLTSDDLAAIGTFAAERGLWILSDEIYSRIVYGAEHDTVMRYGDTDRIVVLDGFSKTYAMTGWRLGYGIMPEAFAAPMARLQTNATSCTASMTQMAGVEALRGPQDDVERMVAAFRERRDVDCVEPQGAFYVFPDVRGTGLSSKELETRLLQEAGVACLSGTAFGAHGDGFLRFSYANSVDNIHEALRRVAGFLERAAARA
jgi:aspartate/methionine/tyrosine aminotransferase